jgi:hypothetical protein
MVLPKEKKLTSVQSNALASQSMPAPRLVLLQAPLF